MIDLGLKTVRRGKDGTYRKHGFDLYTAGIDIEVVEPTAKTGISTHYNAMEFHASSKEEAEAKRDCVLSAILAIYGDRDALASPAATVETDALHDSRNPNHGRTGGLRDPAPALEKLIQRHASAYVARGAAISDNIIAECKASHEALLAALTQPQAAQVSAAALAEPGKHWKPIYVKRWRTLFMVPASLADEIRDTLNDIPLASQVSRPESK